MKRSRKMMGLLLVLLLAISTGLAGCGNSKSSSGITASPEATSVSTPASTADSTPAPAPNDQPDISQKVTLKLYMVGDKGKDTDLVIDQLNQKLSQKLNCTLQLSYISWADWQTKYPLVFASGDDFDAIYAADWSFYNSIAQKNGFMELTDDMLQKNAPNVFKNTPKDFWNQVRINGKVFMVPQLQKEFVQPVYGIRGDLRKKYNVPEVKTFDDLTAYFDVISKNEKGMVGIDGDTPDFFTSLVNEWNEWAPAGNNSNNTLLEYNITDPTSSKLFNILDTPQFLDILKKIREWYQKGYIAKNAMQNKTLQTDLFQNGKSALILQNMNTVNGAYGNIKQSHPDWDLELIDNTMGKKVLPYAATSGGIGIHNTSKNAERMLMVIDYLRYDKEANFLAQRGIKGKHWDIGGDGSDDNLTKPGPDAANYNGDSFAWGAWRNYDYQAIPDPATSVKGYAEVLSSLDSRKVNHPLQTWNMDDTNIKSELTAIKSVGDQYFKPMLYGMIDPVSGIAKLKEKLKAAGLDKVTAEYQKQADDFMKNFSK